MFPTLSKTSMSSSPNCTKPPVSLRRKVVFSFGLKIWIEQFYDPTKSHYNSYWWLQTKAKVKTHPLWLFHQVPEQGAVHLVPSLGASAQDGLELLNTYFHVVVIVHHLRKAYYMKGKYSQSYIALKGSHQKMVKFRKKFYIGDPPSPQYFRNPNFTWVHQNPQFYFQLPDPAPLPLKVLKPTVSRDFFWNQGIKKWSDITSKNVVCFMAFLGVFSTKTKKKIGFPDAHF